LSAPVFYYDFSSPYSYLAAARIDDVLPIRPDWRPVAFGVMVQRLGKLPWSFAADRTEDFHEIDRRAAERGLPPVRYPDGWPSETYSIAALRAALLAAEDGKLCEVSRQLYDIMFVEGRHLADVETVLDAAERAGLDRAAARAGIQRQEIKDLLRATTEQALECGVTGVPTVAMGEQLFWGDDRLEAAAAALSAD
jgi:2-hydroxychromene-2-carboxylate isomerase